MRPDICVHACVFCEELRLVLHKQENVALLSIIPHKEASLEGTVQQKQGYCGLVNGWLILWRQWSVGGAFEQI